MILVTGAAGFIGKNLVTLLRQRPDIDVKTFDVDNSADQLNEYLSMADAICHLAGVNRPENPEEYEAVNAGLTKTIVERLERREKPPLLIFSSSIQAELDNPYGRSKAHAERTICEYAQRTGAPAVIVRLTNVFGKWCRPNYNSVVATLCHNIANGLDVHIPEPNKTLGLVYIDDVVAVLANLLAAPATDRSGCTFEEVGPVYRISVGALAELISRFKKARESNTLWDCADRLTRCLYATYLTHLPADQRVYTLGCRHDERGSLAEFLSSRHFGQLFVSRTGRGQVRGNHVHQSKTEKFCVLEGEAIIRLTSIDGGQASSYRVQGRDFRVVDIPPGYAHSIENAGCGELVVLFWASEPFDQNQPDTHPWKVAQ
jgi:UDP-2-acetamido-2,6-beta-L-arabino-hexul-4-ose reductase